MKLSARSIAARLYPYLVAVPFLPTGLLPPALNAGVVTSAGLLLAAVVCIFCSLLQPRPIAKGAAIALALLVAAGFWFGIASLWATNHTAALLGLVGLHNGASLWVLGAAWVAAGLLCADARSLRETLLVVSLVGVFYAVPTLWEPFESAVKRTQGSAAGFFENSISAGELFAVAILAAIALAFVSRDRRLRFTAVGAALISASGLYVSDSRTGLVGLGAALAFAAVIALAPSSKPKAWVLGAIPPLSALALTTLGLAGARGALGFAAQRGVSMLFNERDSIWRAVLAKFAQAPILGSGLEQFTAWRYWGVAGGPYVVDGTADPHNTLLAAALGGGVIGLALLVAAFVALLTHTVEIARAAGRRPGVALVASAPVLLLGVGLVSWIAPAAMLSVTAITGAFLGVASSNARPESSTEADAVGATPAHLVTLSVGAAAILLAVVMFPVISVQYEYVQSLIRGMPLSAERAEQLYLRSHDPSIARNALENLTPSLQAGDLPAATLARRILGAAAEDATWNSMLTASALDAAQALGANDPAAFPEFEGLVKAGVRADPNSGLWYALAALEANRLGLTETAARYAKEALLFEMDDASRAEIARLAD